MHHWINIMISFSSIMQLKDEFVVYWGSKICYSLVNYSGNTCISNIGDVNNQTLGKEWNTEERLTCRIADNCRGDEWMIIFQALFAEGKTDRISVRTLRSTSLSKNTIPEDAFTAFWILFFSVNAVLIRNPAQDFFDIFLPSST